MGPEVDCTALAALLADYRQDDSSSDSSASAVPDMGEATIVKFPLPIYEKLYIYVDVSAPPDGR